MVRGDELSRQWRLIRLLDHPGGFTVDETRQLKVTNRGFTIPVDFNSERCLEGAGGAMGGRQATSAFGLQEFPNQTDRRVKFEVEERRPAPSNG